MLQNSANQQLEINLTKILLAERGVLVFGVAVQLVATVSYIKYKHLSNPSSIRTQQDVHL